MYGIIFLKSEGKDTINLKETNVVTQNISKLLLTEKGEILKKDKSPLICPMSYIPRQ